MRGCSTVLKETLPEQLAVVSLYHRQSNALLDVAVSVMYQASS